MNAIIQSSKLTNFANYSAKPGISSATQKTAEQKNAISFAGHIVKT
jgi:hypothetical protein